MKPENFDIQVVIDHLQGSCITLEEALENCFPGTEWTDLTSEDHDAIDSQIFLCEDCGWWCEVSEVSEEEEGKCTDCVAPEED